MERFALRSPNITEFAVATRKGYISALFALTSCIHQKSNHPMPSIEDKCI